MSALAEDKDGIGANPAWLRVRDDALRSLGTPGAKFWGVLALMVCIASIGVACEAYQYNVGMGVGNFNNPHVWSLYVSSFIFWIGMSHSGTLLSAILHITKSEWRKPVYRFAEAMTVFSLATASLFLFIHLGRSWQIYYAIPYPNERGLWPSFQSPLIWDALAIATYFASSVVFLYVGCIPDFAICRDNTRGWRRRFYGALALEWQGTDRHWRNFRVTYLTIACFMIPLAVSVHSIVATDFAVSQQPGWHVTSYPPYFVAGALYSGCAAIITLFVILRYAFGFQQYLTLPILRKMVRLTFAMAMVWTYLNCAEFASVWYGPDQAPKDVLLQKMTGVYAPFWWTMIFCGSVLPFVMLVKRLQTSIPAMFTVSLLLNFGMWVERWMIVTPTMAASYYPWTWDTDQWPSLIQWGIVFGSFGFFCTMLMIFFKFVPSISIYEVAGLAIKEQQADKRYWQRIPAEPGAAPR
ncbi:MAG TPA: NrfD/PsrC family molybdoenzyme membrane anchor subunit [Gallionella sp.]|nr:NrfD/PsrC family molybdoenzyme membrane anchor subunit [Gallionella sp.]